jgi:hypothetical protein
MAAVYRPIASHAVSVAALRARLHGSICNHFNGERHLSSRISFKERRAAAFIEWRQLCAA